MSFLEFEQRVAALRDQPEVRPEGHGMPQPHERAQEIVDRVFGIAQALHGRVLARVDGARVDYTLLPRTGTKNSTRQPEAAVDNPDSTVVLNGSSKKKRHGTDAKALRRAEQSAFAIRAKRARRIANFNLFPGKVRSAY